MNIDCPEVWRFKHPVLSGPLWTYFKGIFLGLIILQTSCVKHPCSTHGELRSPTFEQLCNPLSSWTERYSRWNDDMSFRAFRSLRSGIYSSIKTLLQLWCGKAFVYMNSFCYRCHTWWPSSQCFTLYILISHRAKNNLIIWSVLLSSWPQLFSDF